MRKILLATTALVGFATFAPTAQAQTKDSPLNVNIGGYVDFRAGLIAGSNDAFPTFDMRTHGFWTEYKINMDIDGKAMRGIEYGGRISLTNMPTFSGFSGGSDNKMAEAYVYLSGAYGKAVLGDHNGASDLFVYAPTVGLGQVDGQYTNFIDTATVGAFTPSFITENASDYTTKITYMTPKVGNDKHKVQLGVSYAPSYGFQGAQTALYDVPGSYRNNLEAGFQYQGEFSPVSVVLSGYMQSGVGGDTNSTFATHVRDYIAWGIGGQAAYAGFTFGGGYVDAGSYNTVENPSVNQDREQNVFSVGAKYEASKYAVAVNYMRAKGYSFALSGSTSGAAADQDYVKSFNAYSVGGTYTWFPGMATRLDYVFLNQKRADTPSKAAGSVVVVSQKLVF